MIIALLSFQACGRSSAFSTKPKLFALRGGASVSIALS